MNANEEGPRGHDRLSRRVIACAYTVSNELGAGFLEVVYANAFCIELEQCEIPFEREKQLEVLYRDVVVGRYAADLVVAGTLLVEIKALRDLSADHDAQVLNYLRATGLTVGLLLNFGRPRMQVRRLVWGHDDTRAI